MNDLLSIQRRTFLARAGLSLGGAALSGLLARDGLAAGSSSPDRSRLLAISVAAWPSLKRPAFTVSTSIAPVSRSCPRFLPARGGNVSFLSPVSLLPVTSPQSSSAVQNKRGEATRRGSIATAASSGAAEFRPARAIANVGAPSAV